MTTGEKRAELQAKGEPWPNCDCHGKPMYWQADQTIQPGGFFHCAVRTREWRNRRRAERRQQGLCIHCAVPAVTESYCRKCADRHADFMAQPYQKLLHRAADGAYLQRQRAGEGFRPTGAGLAAFAAWTRKDRG